MSNVRKSHCIGCRDDYYNHGNNSMTGQCWGMDTAKIKWVKLIPINLPPPYDHIKKQRKPDCYRRPGYATFK